MMIFLILQTVIVLAAGDIGRCGSTGPRDTAALVAAYPTATVLVLGDLAYDGGSDKQFRDCYDPTWGPFKFRTWPTPGNHEYGTPGAAGYFRYFGSRAGTVGKGYYAVMVGAWRVYALNSNLNGADFSTMRNWLGNDLTAHPTPCIAATWHHATFSSGSHGNNDRMLPIWRRLRTAHATLALVGHDHIYERFKPQTADGLPDSSNLREFVVGTGGTTTGTLHEKKPNSEKFIGNTRGVLKLDLSPGEYRWQFLRAPGGTVLDSGLGTCRG